MSAMKQLSFSDFSPAMKWVTSVAFAFLTSGVLLLAFQVGGKNAEFEQLKHDQNILHEKVEKYNKLEGLILDMAIDVCELRANGDAAAIANCQQIRQHFNR